MTLIDLADDIFRELGQPTDLSIPQISYWLQNNIGQFNVMAAEATVYSVDAQDFVPELTIEQANIFKYMYLVRRYTTLMTNSLGAASYDWSQLQEGDTTIRRVSKNEIAKNYNSIKLAYSRELDRLVFFYKQNRSVPGTYCRDYLLTGDEPY
jgi:hypothetical protein